MPRFRFTPGERHIFRKRPYIPLSEWAADNLIVKDGLYAGARYRKDVNPYLVEIMDTWSLPGVEEVDVSGAAQTGKTLVMHAALAYLVDRRPGPRMLAMQDDDALGKVVANKLLPMFKASPATRTELRKVKASQITFRDSTALFLFEPDSPRIGEGLGIWRAGMDSGGTRSKEDVVSRTEEVYNYVRRHGAGKVFSCKGASHESHTPVRATMIDRLPSSRIRIPGGLWLYLLDTYYFKSLIFARLEPDARQPLTLHRETDQSFAAQICAEALVRDRNGKLAWARKNRNNHYLDCTVMASACVDGAWLPSFQMIVERERAAEAEARLA